MSNPDLPAGLTKVAANFTPRSVLALDLASGITGDSKTDVLNRSVQVYAYLMTLMNDGKLIIIEDPAAGSREKLVICDQP